MENKIDVFKGLDNKKDISELTQEDKIKLANATSDDINKEALNQGKFFITQKNDVEGKYAEIMAAKTAKEKEMYENGEKIIRPHLAENVLNQKGTVLSVDDEDDDDDIQVQENTLPQYSEMDEIEKQILELKKKQKDILEKKEKESEVNEILDEIKTIVSEISKIDREPQWEAPHEPIPLPSNGKLYGMKNEYLKVAYMNADDEDLLTSPNMLQNPNFLEIFIDRKILSNKIRYKDLHIGDRDAILLWLRATSFGNIYPISFYYPEGHKIYEGNYSVENLKTFDVDFDLNSLKIKKLELESDEDGLFTFKLPSNGSIVKFKFLTMGDLDEIKKANEKEDKIVSLSLKKSIVSIDGVKDVSKLDKMIRYMRTMDVRAFNEYYSKHESGVDLRIKIGIPGGESLDTFLPFTTQFLFPKQ